MEVLKKLEPGANGPKRYRSRYGERLVCVRYRLDRLRRRRLTTVELVVDEAPWLESPANSPQPHPNQMCLVRILYSESNVRERVKSVGGQWLPDRKLWRLPLRKVTALGPEKRIVEDS